MPQTKKTQKRSQRSTRIDAAHIGRIVQQYRKARKMTTTVLAGKVGISQAQISRLENGRQGFRSSVLVKIAQVLKIRPWALFMTDIERVAADKAIGCGA